MSDMKSKLPDLKELTDMTSKFFAAMKKSVCEIMADYKKKREDTKAGPVVSAGGDTEVKHVEPKETDEDKDKS